jgi:hypothetical protein
MSIPFFGNFLTCVSSEDLLTLVPAPIALRVNPPVFCNSSTPVNATLSGSFFLAIDDVLPAVSIGSISTSNVFLTDCEVIPAKVSQIWTVHQTEILPPNFCFLGPICEELPYADLYFRSQRVNCFK